MEITLNPLSEKILQRAVTRVVFPAPEDVPCIIKVFAVIILLAPQLV